MCGCVEVCGGVGGWVCAGVWRCILAVGLKERERGERTLRRL